LQWAAEGNQECKKQVNANRKVTHRFPFPIAVLQSFVPASKVVIQDGATVKTADVGSE
jgi:hypothetical protein